MISLKYIEQELSRIHINLSTLSHELRLTQTERHAYDTAKAGVEHLLLAVKKSSVDYPWPS